MDEEIDNIEENVKWSFIDGQMVKVPHPKTIQLKEIDKRITEVKLPSFAGAGDSIVLPILHPVVKPIVELDVYLKLRNLQSGQLHVVINSSLGFLNIGVKMKANVLKWNESISEIEKQACVNRYNFDINKKQLQFCLEMQA